MAIEEKDIKRTLGVYRRCLESMEKLGPEEFYKLETLAPIASQILDLSGKLLVQLEMAKKLGIDPGSSAKPGAPRGSLPW